MTRLRASCLIVLLCGLVAAAPVATAIAGSLRVAPILLEVPAPGATTKLNLRNEGDRILHVQIRVFRWTGTQSEPTLEPTTDVVVSSAGGGIDTRYGVRRARGARHPAADCR